ncbi:MAG: hypothetical protein GYB67_07655 [Chloroflexi bacterium]|nr:hypothetical protein [Chloroflexota bacterium]
MDIQFYDNDQAPKPPEEVVIEQLALVPYPDGFRLYVEIQATPFQQRPNLLLTVRAADGTVVSESSIIETMHNHMEFTMHLRGLDDPAGDYTLTVDLFYETRNPPQDRRVESFVIPAADADNEA